MKRTIAVVLILIIAGSLLQACAASPAKDEEADSRVWEDNGLPVLYITIDQDEFDRVNSSEDHSYRSDGGTATLDSGVSGSYLLQIYDSLK